MIRPSTPSPIRPLAFSTSRNARSWSKCLLSGPTHRAVVRWRGAGGPPGGGGRLPPVRDTLGIVVESGFRPQRMGSRGGEPHTRAACRRSRQPRRSVAWRSSSWVG